MKLLKTITHPDFPTPDIEIVTREAARIILVDENNMVPMIYGSKGDVYKIPGGGIDDGEDMESAVIREAREETGCEIKILGEIGSIGDQRPAYVYKKGLNLDQISYCFYGKVISVGLVEFTESEKERGFEIQWIPKNEVLNKMKSCFPKMEREKISLRRDMYIFEKYLKITP